MRDLTSKSGQDGSVSLTESQRASLAQVVHGMADPALLLTPDLELVAYNDAYAFLVGLRRRQLEVRLKSENALALLAVSPEEDEQLVLRAIANRERLRLDERILKNAKGEEFPAIWTVIPIDDGGVVQGAFITIRDVSAEARMQKRYQDMIAEQTARADELEQLVAERTHELRCALNEVTRVAHTDGLTGILNRRAFIERSVQILAQAERSSKGVALLMFDLDFFKRVNDTYGHDAGDRVLIAASRSIEHSVRRMDIVARLGGEEFVALLPELDAEAALSVAERCAESIRTIDAEALIGARNQRITTSVGLSFFPVDGGTIEELLRASDAALYSAKDSGRDRVVVFENQRFSAEQPAQKRVLVVGTDSERTNDLGSQFEGLFLATVVDRPDIAASLLEREPFDGIVLDSAMGNDITTKLLLDAEKALPSAPRILIMESEAHFRSAWDSLTSASVDRFVLYRERAALVDSLLDAFALVDHQLSHPMVRSSSSGKRVPREDLAVFLDESQIRFTFEHMVTLATDTHELVVASMLPTHGPFETPGEFYTAMSQAGLSTHLDQLSRHLATARLTSLPPSTKVFVPTSTSSLDDKELADLDRRIVLDLSRTSYRRLLQVREQIDAFRADGIMIAAREDWLGHGGLSVLGLIRPDFITIRSAAYLVEPTDESGPSRFDGMLAQLAKRCDDAGVGAIVEGHPASQTKERAKSLGFHWLQLRQSNVS